MNPLKLRDQSDYSETRDCLLQVVKKLKLHTKLVPKTVH